MEYFEESGLDYNALLESIRQKYGTHIHIMNRKKVMLGGILGFGKREGWCVTGYVSDSVFQPRTPETVPETLKKLSELLEKNDFSSSYIQRIISRLEKSSHEESLKSWGYVIKQARDIICGDITTYQGRNLFIPAITAVIGPSGVGKTTTVAKLAASYLKAGKRVGIISTDKYKIGAEAQIKALASGMNIPVVLVGNPAGMRQQIELWSSKAERIIVDTVGRNPRDSKSLIAVGDILSGCGREVEKLLAVSATTKASDLFEIIGQFNMLNFNAVICTKMDETYHAGNIISALQQTGKSLAYITVGQKVTTGIEGAKSERVLEFLEGFDAV